MVTIGYMGKEEGVITQELIDTYGLDAQVEVNGVREIGGTALTLGKALEMEAAFCQAHPERRSSDIGRARKIAQMLSDGGAKLEEKFLPLITKED